MKFTEWLTDLQEMTNVKKMNSHHKNGYIDGIMGHPRHSDAGEHQKEYDAAFRLGTIHRSKLKKAKVKI